MDFLRRQLGPALFLRVICEVAIEIVAVHASQVAAQRDLDRHVQWDAGFHRPSVQTVASGAEARSRHYATRRVTAPMAASSLMNWHESVNAPSAETLNSAASAPAIWPIVRVPSDSSQMRRAT